MTRSVRRLIVLFAALAVVVAGFALWPRTSAPPRPAATDGWN